jgi:hypothetical protein
MPKGGAHGKDFRQIRSGMETQEEGYFTAPDHSTAMSSSKARCGKGKGSLLPLVR